MKRRGISVMECLLALVIVGAAGALLAQFLFAAASQRRADEQRRLALQEVANQLEHAAVVPWDELTTSRLEQAPLSAPAQSALPSAKLTAHITDEPGPFRCRRIRLELGWSDAVGTRLGPVALTSWRFRQENQP